jgi:F-type H+-transporting ATPase subunit delta
LNEKDLDNGWISVGKYLSFCPLFLSFVRQIAINRRFNIFGKIKYIFNIALAKYNNKIVVSVMSAVPLLPEQKKRVEEVIGRLFAEKAMIKYKINPGILGGLKILSEGRAIDASVSMQLKQIMNYLNNISLKVN